MRFIESVQRSASAQLADRSAVRRCQVLLLGRLLRPHLLVDGDRGQGRDVRRGVRCAFGLDGGGVGYRPFDRAHGEGREESSGGRGRGDAHPRAPRQAGSSRLGNVGGGGGATRFGSIMGPAVGGWSVHFLSRLRLYSTKQVRF